MFFSLFHSGDERGRGMMNVERPAMDGRN